jgi:hypothetical protein
MTGTMRCSLMGALIRADGAAFLPFGSANAKL